MMVRFTRLISRVPEPVGYERDLYRCSPRLYRAWWRVFYVLIALVVVFVIRLPDFSVISQVILWLVLAAAMFMGTTACWLMWKSDKEIAGRN